MLQENSTLRKTLDCVSALQLIPYHLLSLDFKINMGCWGPQMYKLRLGAVGSAACLAGQLECGNAHFFLALAEISVVYDALSDILHSQGMMRSAGGNSGRARTRSGEGSEFVYSAPHCCPRKSTLPLPPVLLTGKIKVGQPKRCLSLPNLGH